MKAIRRRLIVVAAAASLAVSCGGSENASAGPVETDNDVSCSANVHDVGFPERYLDGPELTPSELLETSAGQSLDGLFVGGDAELGGGQYRESEGFSIVSEDLVLGYKDGAVTWFFELGAAGDVRSWGGCNPTHLSQEIASRWTPAGHVPSDATVFPIHLEGGACSTENGNELKTVIERIDVEEKLDRVDVTVWTSERSLGIEFCAGVGLIIEAEVSLESPLGDRTLVDAGTIPAIRHPNLHDIKSGRFTYRCGSDLTQASVYDYGSDAVGDTTPEEALQTFPLTGDDSIEHFRMDDIGTNAVYGYTDAAANLVATVTLINLNDSWLLGSTTHCGDMP